MMVVVYRVTTHPTDAIVVRVWVLVTINTNGGVEEIHDSVYNRALRADGFSGRSSQFTAGLSQKWGGIFCMTDPVPTVSGGMFR